MLLPQKKGKKKFNCEYNYNCLEGDLFNCLGLTKGSLKDGVYKHHHRFKNLNKEHETRLITYIWQRKRNGNIPNLEWKKLTKGYPKSINQIFVTIATRRLLSIY